MIAFLVFTSCIEDSSCNQNTETGINFALKRVDESQGSFVFYSPQVVDTIYPRESDTLKWLPLNYASTKTTFHIFTDSASSDILEVYHTKANAELLNVNCGFAGTSTIDSIKFSHTFIDSIWILDPLVETDVYKKNILIYY